MMGDGDSIELVNMVGATSMSHPCIKCSVKEDDKHKDKLSEEIVPTMCLTHMRRISETIVARIVGSANDGVTDNKKPSK
jgi:hypothetical protein